MHYEAIVIGGNFAGLSAAMQLARARRKILLIDAQKPRNRFSEASHGFLGQDGVAPAAIMAEGKRQLAAYPTVAFADGEAISASKTGETFSVALKDGREFTASRLILATGVKDTLPDIPGLPERWGRTALHCPYCHGYEVRDRALGILGSHPFSVHAALLLPDWGPATYFSQGLFEPDADQRAQLAARAVTIENTPIAEFLGAAPELEAVRLRDGRVLPLSAIFVAPKVSMASPLAEQLGCAFDDAPLGPVIRLDDRKETTVKGVYAAGDAANPMHNATLASASGVLAGVHCHQSLALPVLH